MDEDTRFMAVGFPDLNGDGKLDVVMKHPSVNVDHWHKYWMHARFGDGDAPFALTKGPVTVRLANTDGNGLNLDYLALVPVKK